MRGGKYPDFRGMRHTLPKNPATCTHPNVEMAVGRNLGWCKTCFATILDYSSMPGPDINEKQPPKPAQRGQQVQTANGQYVLVTRVDLQVTAGGLVSHKFADGWFERQRNTDLGLRTEPKWTLDAAVEWLEAHGYTVHRWPGGKRWPEGARAWLGEIRPVRTKAQILMLRNQVAYEMETRRNQSAYEMPNDPAHPGVEYNTLDLAYDL